MKYPNPVEDYRMAMKIERVFRDRVTRASDVQRERLDLDGHDAFDRGL